MEAAARPIHEFGYFAQSVTVNNSSHTECVASSLYVGCVFLMLAQWTLNTQLLFFSGAQVLLNGYIAMSVILSYQASVLIQMICYCLPNVVIIGYI